MADAPDWQLVYWPGIKGRGEYVRLMFEEAGVAYQDVGVEGGFKVVAELMRDGTWEGQPWTGFPVRAPPILIKRGTGFALCGTNVIQSYLNGVFGWGPSDAEGKAHVDQVLAIVADGVAEARLAFHPKDAFASHKTQVEESQPYIKQWGTQRLPKYLQHFEALLVHNGGSKGAPGFLLGCSISAADLAVYQFLAAAEHHYTSHYEASVSPLLRAFKAAIEARPRISAYLASPRCQPWDADSFM